MWGFLVAIISPLIEKFLVWIFKLIKRDIEEWRESKDRNKTIDELAKKLKQAKSPEERRRATEDLVNLP